MARLPRRSIVTLFALVLLALTTPAALALAQQFGAPPQYGAPCPPPGFPPQPGVPPQPGCAPGTIQQPFGAAPGMPAQPYGATPPGYGNPQPYGGMPAAPMPGGTWSWPPQGSAWPVQPGAQEIVAPDAGQSQPLTPGVPTQTHVPGFVRKPAPPPPAQPDFQQPPPQQ